MKPNEWAGRILDAGILPEPVAAALEAIEGGSEPTPVTHGRWGTVQASTDAHGARIAWTTPEGDVVVVNIWAQGPPTYCVEGDRRAVQPDFRLLLRALEHVGATEAEWDAVGQPMLLDLGGCA